MVNVTEYILLCCSNFLFRVPRIPDNNCEFCSLMGHATVLLIDVVFIGEDFSEFATIKCVQEEGTRFYQLIEVTNRVEGTVCDCKFLEQ